MFNGRLFKRALPFTGATIVRIAGPLQACRKLSAGVVTHFPQQDEPPHSQFTHLSSSGEARMVSIAPKAPTSRVAVAIGAVHFSSARQNTSQVLSAAAEKKGDILAVARIAGIQAAKQTSTIIPLCHNIPLSSVEVTVQVQESKIEIKCRVECVGSTGVEMEALCGVMGAGLCLYDMCKSVDKGMRIDGVKVIEKRGGKSGDWINGKQI